MFASVSGAFAGVVVADSGAAAGAGMAFAAVVSAAFVSAFLQPTAMTRIAAATKADAWSLDLIICASWVE
jgi:hypothetical protein